MAERDDKAGQAYWDGAWRDRPLPPRFDPDATHLTACVDRGFERFFQRAFAGVPREGSLVEVGCGASVLLPYFGRRFGFSLAGVDYSPDGVEQSRALLAREGVEGDVRQGDLFAPPDDLLGRFDVVFSLGLVEHFTDAPGCLRALARLARPGGRVVTVIPNLAGAIGAVQKVLDRSVYDVHVPHDRESLREAHAAAGLTVTSAEYLLAMNFGVLNVSRLRPSPRALLARAAMRVLVDASRAVWRYESLAGELTPRRGLSPYVCVVARVGDSARS